MRAFRTVAVAVLFALALAATVPLGSSSVLAAGLNRVSASTLLSNACRASFGASAFRVQGHVTTGGTAMSLDAYFGSAGDLITFTEKGDETVSIIVNGPSTYFKGNRSFWLSMTPHDGAVASLFAGRWIDMTSDKKDTADLTKRLSKRALLAQGVCGRSATFGGNTIVYGVKVDKVQSPDGSTVYIENGPTPHILRAIASPGQKYSGELAFSNYGVQPDTAAPPGAIPISAFGSTGSTGGTGS
jgi:hypothetical protein